MVLFYGKILRVDGSNKFVIHYCIRQILINNIDKYVNCTLCRFGPRVGFLVVIQLFRERLSQKLCTQQSRKVIWDMINALVLDTVAVEPTFVAFL